MASYRSGAISVRSWTPSTQEAKKRAARRASNTAARGALTLTCPVIFMEPPGRTRPRGRLADFAGSVEAPEPSLRLDADRFDESRPLGFLAIDHGGLFLGRGRLRLGAFLGETPANLLGCERRAQLLVEPLHDGTRPAGRCHQAVAPNGGPTRTRRLRPRTPTPQPCGA